MRQLWRNFCKNWQVLIGLIWFFGTGSLPFWAPSVLLSLKIPPESLRGFGLYLLGTGTAPLGLYLTYSRTASLRSQTDNEKDKNVTDAFARSVELLGNESRATRQGGIYSLGRIARDNSKLHSTIFKIITSYIRDKSYSEFNRKLEEENHGEEELIRRLHKQPMPVDIEAAIEIITRREQKHDDTEGAQRRKEYFLDLSNAYIFNGIFTDTNLCDSKFSDSKIMDCAFLKVNLSGSFFKAADLQGSLFEDCDLENCNFENTKLIGVKFKKCKLTGAKKLSQEQIEKAEVCEETVLPKGLIHPSKENLEGSSTV